MATMPFCAGGVLHKQGKKRNLNSNQYPQRKLGTAGSIPGARPALTGLWQLERLPAGSRKEHTAHSTQHTAHSTQHTAHSTH
jgi:hypothetical protein